MIRFHSPSDLHKSGYVARVYALRDVVLAELTANRTMTFGETLSDSVSRGLLTVDDSATGRLHEDGQLLLVTVHFNIAVKREESPILTVGGAFELRYERQVEDTEVAPEDVQLFSEINGVYNCWPYMREIVASTFARLGYPPLTLDSLVIAPDPERSEAPSPS